MGMAASQARYLALVARKSNCEYEGQQINQARTALSNQSANLFNQMLGLSVPIPPSTQDFTKTQYSYTDGINGSTIESWQQLPETDENYNYVVTHYYNTEIYTGAQKKMNDPQVQFTGNIPLDPTNYSADVSTIQRYQLELDARRKDYDEALAAYNKLISESKDITSYEDSKSLSTIISSEKNEDDNFTITTQATSTDAEGKTYTVFTSNETPSVDYHYDGTKYYTVTDGTYADATIADGVTLTPKEGTNVTYAKYDSSIEEQKTAFEAWQKLLGNTLDSGQVYYDSTNKTFAFAGDLSALNGAGGAQTVLPIYHTTGENTNDYNTIEGINEELDKAEEAVNTAKIFLGLAESAYDSLSVPEYVGNCELNNLSELTKDQKAEIDQIIKDMKEQEVATNFTKYYNPETGKYNGGIMSFKLNGITYYTTYDDLANSAVSGTGPNHIDGQIKLPYYNASYVETKVEKTEKALVETDNLGRFTSIRFEDDTVKYTLTMETITDDVAYQDAMNQYYYENAKYDKMVQDINAKTSIIQHEDQQLELRLKQLDTEQKALSTEMEAVKKVVDSNVESSFKTFNG